MEKKLKKFHKELEKTAEERIPLWVSKKLISLIPERDEGSTEDYVFISQVYTLGEYTSVVTLYDKLYKSPLHEYGTKEELLFSYRNIKSGLLKEHHIRNERGKFDDIQESIKPSNLTDKVCNVMLIKRTEWDSYKVPSKSESYTIIVFNKSNFVIESRKQELAQTINKAKEYNKKGPEKDGNSESLQIG